MISIESNAIPFFIAGAKYRNMPYKCPFDKNLNRLFLAPLLLKE